eukprot:scaffold40_cov305-Pinguiococcus_pyrenoidosus.AAC.30
MAGNPRLNNERKKRPILGRGTHRSRQKWYLERFALHFALRALLPPLSTPSRGPINGAEHTRRLQRIGHEHLQNSNFAVAMRGSSRRFCIRLFPPFPGSNARVRCCAGRAEPRRELPRVGPAVRFACGRRGGVRRRHFEFRRGTATLTRAALRFLGALRREDAGPDGARS